MSVKKKAIKKSISDSKSESNGKGDVLEVVQEDGSLLEEGSFQGNIESVQTETEDVVGSAVAKPNTTALTVQAFSSENEVLSNYIRQISVFPILTPEEEARLFDLYIDRQDQKAGQAIVMSHLRLVVKIAMQYKKFGLNMMDVIAEGNVGLLTALQKFDRSKKARFSTYASLWVKAKVQEFILRSWNIIKCGSQAVRKQLLFNFSGVKKMLGIGKNTDTIERDKKIANYFGLNNAEYSDVINSITNRELSLDAPATNDPGSRATMLDVLDTGNNFVYALQDEETEKHRKQIFKESLSILNDRQREIIFARYLNEGKKATLEELSEKFHVSKERIRQIEESAIKQLKLFADNYQKHGKL